MDGMFGERHRESAARRGLEEALACKDVLASVPPRPSALARAGACIAALAQRLGRLPRRRIAAGRPVPQSQPPVAP